jgi:hypothetical protein
LSRVAWRYSCSRVFVPLRPPLELRPPDDRDVVDEPLRERDPPPLDLERDELPRARVAPVDFDRDDAERDRVPLVPERPLDEREPVERPPERELVPRPVERELDPRPPARDRVDPEPERVEPDVRDRDPLPDRELLDRPLLEREPVERDRVEPPPDDEREPPLDLELLERPPLDRDPVDRERDEPPDDERERVDPPDADRDRVPDEPDDEREREEPEREPLERDPPERDAFEREPEPPEREPRPRDVPEREPEPPSPPSPPSSPPSSSSPINFFATVTAAGIATPSAAPATTFCGVDMPSSSSERSLSCSSAIALTSSSHGQLASLNASMNRGTIRSRTTSGAFSATYLPADSAKSSASGKRTPDAAFHALAAAADTTPVAPSPSPCDRDFFLLSRSPESSSRLPSSSWWLNAFRAASVAAPVAAAAAAALSAVLRAPPPDRSVSSVTGISRPPSGARSAPALLPRPAAGRAGAPFRLSAAAQVLDARHQRLVDAVERGRSLVRVLADLVRDLDQPLEIRPVLDLRPQLADEILEVVGDLLDVFHRCHVLLLSRTCASKLFPKTHLSFLASEQRAERTEIEVEVLVTQAELLLQLVHALRELHERLPQPLDLLVVERSRFHAPDRLPLHELAQELDEGQDELGEAALDRLGICRDAPLEPRLVPRRQQLLDASARRD